MNSVLEYIQDSQYQNIVNEYLTEIIAEEIINEAFQSSLLTALAKAIDKAEEPNKERYKESYKRWKESGKDWGEPNKTTYYKNFTSIFGPKTEGGRYNIKKGLQGLNWSIIKDDDFVKYNADSKEFKKIIKQAYDHKISANFICCKPGTQEVICFIKGYSGDPKEDLHFYFFGKWGWNTGAVERKVQKGKYGERSLKMIEALPLIQGLDIYTLIITDNMKMEYKTLTTNRENSQKGVINYDKASLDAILKEQKARYKALVEKMKAANLQGDIEGFFDDIVKTNNEVIELFKKVTGNPKNMDMNFDLGDLMTYVNYAYEQFYKSMKYKREAEKSDEQYGSDSLSRFDKERADNAIRDSKEYLDKVKKKIKEIQNKIV